MTQLEDTIKKFVDSNKRSFMSSNNYKVVEALEQIFQFKIPNSYRMLLCNFEFDPFSIDEIDFYGSFELLKKIQNDNALFIGLRKAKMMQIGRPDDGIYDPICIDGTAKRKRGELPLVRVCHESILIGSKIKIIHRYPHDIPAMLMSMSNTWP